MKEGRDIYAPNHLNVLKQAHSSIAIEQYPAYFEQNQLYDLDQDPYEQNNLANDVRYSEILKRLRKQLITHLKSFQHPFSFEKIPFMETV